MVHPTVDPAKLADVQGVAAKLSLLPEQLLMYIAGYTEGVLAMAVCTERTDIREKRQYRPAG